MKTQKQFEELNRVLIKAQEDLKIWLHYTDSSTLEEFFNKSDEIKIKSFHKYDDVIRQLQYINKIQNKIFELSENIERQK